MMKPKDRIKCCDWDLSHVTSISTNPVVNVVMDEFYIHVVCNLGFVCRGWGSIPRHGCEAYEIYWIGEQSVHHLRGFAVVEIRN